MIRDLTELQQLAPGHFAGAFDATWCQGPGIYGGLIAAAIGRSVERTLPGRPVRTLSVQLCAPLLPAPFELHVVEERSGQFVSYGTVRVVQQGKPAVIAQVTCGIDRPVEGDLDHSEAPVFPLPHTLPKLGSAPGVPVFTQHFEFRFVEGVPFSGSERAVSGGWLRPTVPAALDTSLELAMLDAWPLAVLPTFRGPRRAASIVIQFHLFEATAAPDAWFRVRVESQVQQGGYSEQTGKIWGPDGKLVGLSHQLVVRLT